MRPSPRLLCALCFASLLILTGCSGGSGDFALTAMPARLSIQAGSSVTLSVVATAAGGFRGPVNVALSGLPVGITASPASFALTPGTAQTVTLAAAASTSPATGTFTLTGTSGALSHATSVALTATPAADFTLSVSPSSQSLTAGGAGSQVMLLATASNGFTGTVTVTPSGLPAGVTASPAPLSLSPGVSQGITLVAGSSAVAGSANVTFTGISGGLSHTASLALTISPGTTPIPPPSGQDVTTYHNSNARDGLYAHETMLTPANVNAASFGLRGVYPVDGKVDAQPLLVSGLAVQTGTMAGTLDLLLVATEHDSVYALDASSGVQVWKTSILGTSETTSDPRNCGQITPEIGITSTPVIDRSYGKNGAIFAVGMSKDAGGHYHQRLHALDLATGAELPGSPEEITASYPGTGAGSSNGKVVFDPAQYAERAGLLLLNGTIYTTWTSHCDIAPYTGWVIGYSEATLQQSTVLNLTPNGSDGSIWMSGFAPAADSSGNIYLLDANGTLDSSFTAAGFPSRDDYGNSILKLGTAGGLSVLDFFEPYNTVDESNRDLDLGSGGAMLLPDLTDSTGAVRHLLVGAGKDGNLYIADRDHLGKFHANGQDNSNLYQEIPNALPNGAWSGPAYFNNTVFYAGVNDVLKAYSISGAKLSANPTSRSATSFGYPGATPSVSANGTENGIVWAVESGTSAPAVLHAYDAADLTRELYNSREAPNNRDAFGNGNKFITPVVANGQVYVGTPDGVAVFGLLK